MPDVRIRRAQEDEFDIVASLIVDSYAEYAAAMSPDAWSMFAQDIANVHGRRGDAELIVAELNDRLVGAVTISHGWRGTRPGSAAMRLLSVPPSERKSGIGTALMGWCVEYARACGKQRLVMTTTQEMVAMRDLSAALGFARAPELDHEPAPGVRVKGYALTLERDRA